MLALLELTQDTNTEILGKHLNYSSFWLVKFG